MAQYVDLFSSCHPTYIKKTSMCVFMSACLFVCLSLTKQNCPNKKRRTMHRTMVTVTCAVTDTVQQQQRSHVQQKCTGTGRNTGYVPRTYYVRLIPVKRFVIKLIYSTYYSYQHSSTKYFKLDVVFLVCRYFWPTSCCQQHCAVYCLELVDSNILTCQQYMYTVDISGMIFV